MLITWQRASSTSRFQSAGVGQSLGAAQVLTDAGVHDVQRRVQSLKLTYVASLGQPSPEGLFTQKNPRTNPSPPPTKKEKIRKLL